MADYQRKLKSSPSVSSRIKSHAWLERATPPKTGSGKKTKKKTKKKNGDAGDIFRGEDSTPVPAAPPPRLTPLVPRPEVKSPPTRIPGYVDSPTPASKSSPLTPLIPGSASVTDKGRVVNKGRSGSSLVGMLAAEIEAQKDFNQKAYELWKKGYHKQARYKKKEGKKGSLDFDYSAQVIMDAIAGVGEDAHVDISALGVTDNESVMRIVRKALKENDRAIDEAEAKHDDGITSGGDRTPPHIIDPMDFPALSGISALSHLVSSASSTPRTSVSSSSSRASSRSSSRAPSPAPDEDGEDDISGGASGGAASMAGAVDELAGGGDGGGEKAKEEVMKKTEKEILDKAMNRGSEGGDSNLKAAGDSGMGNPLNYDFIRAEGRAKSTGQNILSGAQTSNKVAEANRSKAEREDENGLAVNTQGQNQQLTMEDLTKRLELKGSDKILDPVTYDHGRASLRPQFLLGGEDAVRKTAREKMEMDAQFDMFDFVPEGFGLGAHNKMFIQEKNHDRLIRYAEPMYEPRAKDGSEYTNDQFDPRLMPQIDNSHRYLIRKMNDISEMSESAKRQKVASVDTLADDNNAIKSSKGLRGRKPSPFEPVIRTRSPWIPTTEPAGVNMKRQLKSIFNTQRTPQRHVEYNPHNGMPTLDKRRAMEIILP